MASLPSPRTSGRARRSHEPGEPPRAWGVIEVLFLGRLEREYFHGAVVPLPKPSVRSRAVARSVLVFGIVAVVIVPLQKCTPCSNAYDFSGSSRLAWSFVLIAMLVVASYGAGLPDLPQSARTAAKASAAVLASAGIGISLLQLFLGDAVRRYPGSYSAQRSSCCSHGSWRVGPLLGVTTSGERICDPVFFVGPGADAALLNQDLAGDTEIPARGPRGYGSGRGANSPGWSTSAHRWGKKR